MYNVKDIPFTEGPLRKYYILQSSTSETWPVQGNTIGYNYIITKSREHFLLDQRRSLANKTTEDANRNSKLENNSSYKLNPLGYG